MLREVGALLRRRKTMEADALQKSVLDAVTVRFSGNSLTDALRGTATQRGSFRSATMFVKQIFGDLGHALGYKVSASGYPSAEGREWLYDMCWFRDDADCLLDLALVLETEMIPGGSVMNAAFVDTDFQKILQARAKVRVWFCALPNEQFVAAQREGCIRQIKVFEGSQIGDRYILIFYNWTSGASIVEAFEH